MCSLHLPSVVLLVLLGALVENYTEACSCMPEHPQEYYCKSDFVIVARIRKEFKTENHKIYKAKIRKEFKVKEKAKLALKSGKIMTALDGAMCGSDLEIGKLYLLTGYVQGTQAHINLCGFVRQVKSLTPRQRKGFRLIYSKGCDCKFNYYTRIPHQKDRCSVSNIRCHSDHGICLRSPSGQCHWSKSQDLKRCLTGNLTPNDLTTKFRKPEMVKPITDNNLKYFYHATSIRNS